MKKKRLGLRRTRKTPQSKRSELGVNFVIFELLLKLFFAPVIASSLVAAGVLLQGTPSALAFIGATISYVYWGMWIVKNSPAQIENPNYISKENQHA